MLVITRSPNEKIHIGNQIKLKLNKVEKDNIFLEIIAPAEILNLVSKKNGNGSINAPTPSAAVALK